MSPFRVYILGCGSALPTDKHNPSAQAVEVRERMFLVDCGEGTQLSLRRMHVNFNRIQGIFISHLHGDHCLGLIGLISTMNLADRTAPFQVYAPAEYRSLFTAEMDFFCHDLSYEVTFHPVDTTVCQTVYEDSSITVVSLPLDHRVPCCGYLFRERQGRPHLRRDMMDQYGIPYSQADRIKAGDDYVTADGTTLPNAMLVTPADRPRAYAYCSDTRYMPGLHRLIAGVNVLYHESTYAQDRADRAGKYFHSTARDAATVAREAGVGQLYIGHYSARYDDEQVLLDEAREVFPETFLTREGMVIDVE